MKKEWFTSIALMGWVGVTLVILFFPTQGPGFSWLKVAETVLLWAFAGAGTYGGLVLMQPESRKWPFSRWIGRLIIPFLVVWALVWWI